MGHMKLIETLEGYSDSVYTCSANKKTVGVGFNMDAAGARELWGKLKIPEDFNEVYNGQATLSRASVSKLVEKQWKHAENLAKSRTRQLGLQWSVFSPMKQFCLADICFNTGSIGGWTKVFHEVTPEGVLRESRRRQREIDSRICKTAHYFGYAKCVDDCIKIGLTHAKYIV